MWAQTRQAAAREARRPSHVLFCAQIRTREGVGRPSHVLVCALIRTREGVGRAFTCPVPRADHEMREGLLVALRYYSLALRCSGPRQNSRHATRAAARHDFMSRSARGTGHATCLAAARAGSAARHDCMSRSARGTGHATRAAARHDFKLNKIKHASILALQF